MTAKPQGRVLPTPLSNALKRKLSLFGFCGATQTLGLGPFAKPSSERGGSGRAPWGLSFQGCETLV